MQAYVAKIKSYGTWWTSRRPSNIRGNRGRNRSAADKQNQSKFWRDRGQNVRKAVKKSARRAAKEEIAHELFWVEIDTMATQLEHTLSFATVKRLTSVWEDDWDSYEQSNWEEDHRLSSYVDPQTPEWRDAWIAGEVDSHSILDGLDPCLDPYDDLDWRFRELDILDDEIAEYEDWLALGADAYDYDYWTVPPFRYDEPADRLRADRWRNAERLKAGERYYQTHKRTVDKSIPLPPPTITKLVSKMQCTPDCVE